MPSPPSSPAIASSHTHPTLGDLRAISRKGWSRSADDLNQISSTHFSPIKTSFQDKVTEYRNRSNSNTCGVVNSVPSSPTVSSINGRHPFPSVNTTTPHLLATSPRKGSLPTVSISISAPIIDENPSLSIRSHPTHVHTRSHSFTPRLPSKLASPLLSPSSTKHKGYGLSDVDIKPPHSAPVRIGGAAGTFPFSFGSPSSSSKQSVSETPPTPSQNHHLHRVTTATLLAPPTIEPGTPTTPTGLQTYPTNTNMLGAGGEANKRLSQIVYHSGFLNRLADAPASHHMMLGKGWKPFKGELRGSKLHFWKPPGDRAAGVKELFPTELVPPGMEDEEGSEGEAGDGINNAGGGERDGTGKARGRDDTVGRKKRAFWGRRTHPDIVRVENGVGVQRGTFEALVHEAAFGTTFGLSVKEKQAEGGEGESTGSPTAAGDNVAEEQHMEEWRTFASSIILCLPSIVGRGKFETELLRCCSYLVSGAEDDVREVERQRVGWLAGEYMRYHGSPADLGAWDEWRAETIPHALGGAVNGVPVGSMLPMSSSMQAMHHPSPLMEGSPNVGVFSPRPGGTTGVNGSSSLMETLKREPGALSSPKKGDAVFRNMVWIAVLEQEGLSRDVLRVLDPHLVAHSLMVFHRSVMDKMPDDLTAEFVIELEEGLPSEASTSTAAFASLLGTNDQPQWLTRLVLLQVLGASTSGGNGQQQESRISRSDVISIWARVGELCRLAGDECSWRAIFSALCSRPVARLDKTWRGVSRHPLAAVESWVYPDSSNGEALGVKEPKITPWGGDIRMRVKEELGKAIEENGDGIVVKPLEDVTRMFEGFRTAFGLCPRRVPVGDGEEETFGPEEVKKLVGYWTEMAREGGGVEGAAAKFQRVDQFMSLSFAVEPRRKGHFEPYFWSRSTPGHTSLLPLLFPEPLPTVSLVDRGQLLRGRVDSDTPDVTFLRGLDNRRPERSGLADLRQRGTVIPVYNGDLLLVVQNASGLDSTPSSRPSSSRAPSRPPSSIVDTTTEKTLGRNTSIRVKPRSSQNLDRKSSVARRNSLPSLSQRQNFVLSERSSEPPLRVIVQAGTLNNLINILVFGLQNVSVSVADDNGEMTLKEGMTRELMVDRVEFAKVWWNVFRSFVSPFVFFEHLRKLYISAQPFGSSPPASEYVHVSGVRCEVLDTMKEWLTVGGGVQDVLDDPQLFLTLRTFLDTSSDHAIYEPNKSSDPNVDQCLSRLAQSRDAFRSSFISQALRPLTTRGPPIPRGSSHANGARTRTLSMSDPPDFERVDAEEFVDNLDGMASALYSKVTEDDLYAAADVLEAQSADRTGWFTPRESSTFDDTIEIQNIYSHIMDVESSSLISGLNQDIIYRLLPPSIRSCVRAHRMIRKWIVSKIVAPQLGIRTRQARMELLLKVIELARLRNAASRPFDQPCVRSFVEAVTTSAIMSVESRVHARSWQNVAILRGAQCDSLASLLFRPSIQSSSPDSLTPDMGWVMERILEVVATPDTLDSGIQDNALVNFDKRRNLCSFLDSALWLPSARRRLQSDELTARGFDRLTRAEEEVSRLQFDHKWIKEEAAREASYPALGTSAGKKLPRPFQRLVLSQQEKNRRDKNLRSRFQKEKLQEQAKIDRRDEILNRAMRPRKQGAVLHKQHRNKKSMSAFLHFMRPISSAFGADLQPSSGAKRRPAELDFLPSGKPALVVSLMDARIAQFINNERSYTFQLDTEDGGHYILQATSKREMNKWIDTINRVTNLAAKRRLTYLGNSPKPQVSDHIHNPVIASQDPKAVFGVELQFLLRREAGLDLVKPGVIPLVIERCLAEIEARGLTEVGIYRIAGAVSEINALRDAFNRGESPITSSNDIHAVCDLVKAWFRVLPEPIFPSSFYHDVIRAMHLENLDARLSNIRNVVQALPQANFDLLKRVSEHLDKVTDFEEHNHMTAEALAIVFSPNLLRAPQNDFSMIITNMGHTHKLVKALITHFHVIFDDVDPDGEAPSDEDYDSPIMEEDEDEDEGSSHDSPEPQASEADQVFSMHDHDDNLLYTPS